MEKERSFWRLPMQIAAGLLIVGLLGFVARLVLVGVVVEGIGSTSQRAMVDIGEQAKLSAERARRVQVARQAEVEADRIRKLRAEAARLQAAADRERAILVAEENREIAWRKFYRPSRECLRAASVECGNEHIRARREFEGRYASGQLN